MKLLRVILISDPAVESEAKLKVTLDVAHVCNVAPLKVTLLASTSEGNVTENQSVDQKNPSSRGVRIRI